MFKIDPTILQTVALAGAIGLGVGAACYGQWGIVASTITGLFALLGLRRSDMPNAPSTDGDPK